MDIYNELLQLLEKNKISNINLNIITANNQFDLLEKIAKQFDIQCNIFKCEHFKNVLQLVHNFNNDQNCNGIYIDNNSYTYKTKGLIYSNINPKKDVNVLNPVSLGLILHKDYFIFPPEIELILKILNNYNLINTSILIIDNFNFLSSILASILITKGSIVTQCNYQNIYYYYASTSDIIICLTDITELKDNNHSVYINFGNNNTKLYNKDYLDSLLNLYIIYNFIRLIKIKGE